MSLIINIPLAANSESFIAVRLEIIVRLPNINTSKLQMTQHKQGEEKKGEQWQALTARDEWPWKANIIFLLSWLCHCRWSVWLCYSLSFIEKRSCNIIAFVSALVVVVALVGCKGFLFILSFLLTGKKWAGLFDFNKTWVTSAALEKLHFYATNSLMVCALIRKPFFLTVTHWNILYIAKVTLFSAPVCTLRVAAVLDKYRPCFFFAFFVKIGQPHTWMTGCAMSRTNSKRTICKGHNWKKNYYSSIHYPPKKK